jgi:proteasome lid subunit RPN8/RPN11
VESSLSQFILRFLSIQVHSSPGNTTEGEEWLGRDPILIRSDAFLKLIESAYSSYQHGFFVEKIGVVIGIGNLLIDFIEATKESTPTFCSLDHDKIFQASKSLSQGEAIVGWFHTHNGFSTPSYRDERTQSYWQAFPGTVSIIVDVKHAKIVVWRLESHGIEELSFQVIPAVREASPAR